MEFKPFQKIPRLSRPVVVTEKLDGTNGCIYIADDFKTMQIGSRTRWITPESDNFGFAKWCKTNEEELLKLGPGLHYGEWWGQGIQRGYGLKEKKFSLFNVSRWFRSPSPPFETNLPQCCDVVPILYKGPFDIQRINTVLDNLAKHGSMAVPGFMKPEGIVVYHVAGNILFKKTIEKDDEWKGKSDETIETDS